MSKIIVVPMFSKVILTLFNFTKFTKHLYQGVIIDFKWLSRYLSGVVVSIVSRQGDAACSLGSSPGAAPSLAVGHAIRRSSG